MARGNRTNDKTKDKESESKESDVILISSDDEEVMIVGSRKVASSARKHSTRRGPGRIPGQEVGKKRKREEEYSQTPSSIKSRTRLSKMTVSEQKVERAKAADLVAESRVRKAVRETSEWINADKDTRIDIMGIAISKEMLKRVNNGNHASVIAQELGIPLSSRDKYKPEWYDPLKPEYQ